MNLGSPDSPAVGDVRRFLREFLMDGRVMDIPWVVRFFLVQFLILPSRPKKSAEAYRKVWLPEGSPLVVTSKNVREKLQARIGAPVELAMRYQNPRIEQAVDNLLVGDCETIAERLCTEIRVARPSHMMFHFQVGASSFKKALTSIEKFQTHIKPMVEKELGPLTELNNGQSSAQSVVA